MRLLGALLIILSALQSTPFFVSNIIIYALIYLLVFLYAFHIKKKKNTESIWKLDKYLIFYLVWLLFGLVSFFWSVDKFFWFRSCVILIIVTSSIFIFQQFIRNEEDIVFYLRVFFCTFLANNVIGWFEVFTSKYIITTTENVKEYSINHWPVASFLNTNDFCTYLAVSIPFVLAYFIYQKDVRVKSVIVLSIFSSLLLMLKASSRANILAVILGLILLWILDYLIDKLKNYRFLGAFFVVVVLSLVIVFSTSLGERILDVFVNNDRSSDQLRLNLIRNGLIHLKNSHFIGVGAGNLQYWLPNHQYYNTFNFLYIHNWWVEVLVNYGVIIFVGYFLSWINLFFTAMFKPSFNPTVSKVLGAGIVIFSLAVFSPSSMLLMKWLPIYTGISISCISLLEKKEGRKNSEKTNK